MKTLNFFNITKMSNKFTDFKNYLKLLSPEERLHEKYITQKNYSTNKAYKVQLKSNRYAALKPLKNKFMRLDKMLK